MLIDSCACNVSLSDPSALESWNGVVHGVLSHGSQTGHHLTDLLARAPDFAMGHAMKGLACLMLGRREMVAIAQAASDEAQRLLAQGGALQRERLWCMALLDWLDGKPANAVLRMEAAIRLNLTDTISMKLSHGIRFMLGDRAGMLQSVERVLDAHGPDHAYFGYALGCHAFALEEAGNFNLAEAVGRRALQFSTDDAWGLHAVAHVYDMTNKVDAGIALIDNNAPAWDHCNNFRFHVWWHKALLHLGKNDIATVLDLYDTKIRDEKTDDYRDFSNASSLLMRLELEGIDVSDRWSELADLAETRSTDGCLTFADMHYMLALIGDTRHEAAAELNARVIQSAQIDDDTGRVMRSPGEATSAALAAFGHGDYSTAFAQFKSAQPYFQAMGGSHAQRDVFERLAIEAGLRAGRLAETQMLLSARTSARDGNDDAFAVSRQDRIMKLQSAGASATAAE
ncbi:tetratricopeptide repeat protein [Neptunicoccus cionae]|uniref:Tetratricopeptide repeat protein 38 n=1 Tax=Neptunicoccus cionae TaxID=2035344 RepID=A0A916R3H5_9RHOB|nr:tetratricopeptide repeat protein [Amylibacter cionae]GGA31139.1 tetratricopeptide repeat protein 38 family protein [Amylibacter cionae]